jgi:predicted  nucleic acid-binding Zn-ribbon protein
MVRRSHFGVRAHLPRHSQHKGPGTGWDQCEVGSMSEVKTLATLILGGVFDNRELGDIDISYSMSDCEELQQSLVKDSDDVHVELVSRIDFDAAQAELSALREELCTRAGDIGRLTGERDSLREELASSEDKRRAFAKQVSEGIDQLEAKLTAAEQRNAELVEIITEVAKQAGDHHMSHQTWNLKTHLANIHQKLEAALNPTESGASDKCACIRQPQEPNCTDCPHRKSGESE